MYLSESGPFLAMINFSLLRPPTGTRSLPVANCSNFLFDSRGILWTISQKFRMMGLSDVYPPSYSVASSNSLKSKFLTEKTTQVWYWIISLTSAVLSSYSLKLFPEFIPTAVDPLLIWTNLVSILTMKGQFGTFIGLQLSNWD